MLIGVLCAIGACLAWGLVFVTPLLLADYPGMLLSFGRYTAFGLVALVPAWLDRRRMRALTRADWMQALSLSFIGNLLYYAMLATGIQLADAPLPTMVVGTLPVAIAVCANWSPAHGAEPIAWRRLAPSLAIILAGLALVNASELSQFAAVGSGARRSVADYVLGCLLAAAGVATWTWYPIVNARYLRRHTHINPVTWATAQGLTTLPLALLGFAGYGVYGHLTGSSFAFPLGPQPGLFVALMLVIGLTASWLGILLWNQASVRLPTSLAGQLMVFETLFALLYAFILRGSLPTLEVGGGIVLLCGGVLMGVRVFRQHAAQ